MMKLLRLLLLFASVVLTSGCTSPAGISPTSSPQLTAAPPSAISTPVATPTLEAAEPSTTAIRERPSPSPLGDGTSGDMGAPPPCSGAGMLYHQGLERIVLLDCYAREETNVLTRIWGWNGQGWEVLDGEGPPGRDLGGAAYDSRRDRLVVYGGYYLGSQECSRETWEWDSTGWTKVDVASPAPCNHFKMTYDAARGKVVLFGGQNEAQQQLAETWTWDGTSWQDAAPAESTAQDHPASRAHFGFVYDSTHEQTLLYGGYNGTALGDFWSWNGSSWQSLRFTGPGTRSHLGMALDVDAGALMTFGGAKSSSTFGSLTDETWILSGGAWSRAQVDAPPPRGSPAMAYDPGEKKILLYGGFTRTEDYADTWEWDGSMWTCRAKCP